ncbi:UDP-perosamine 4-acetyltransferase [Pseudomonas sp. 2848]|jgi:UDP-perosamine 4-acetyltransferase|uniref:acetyltransferase n=1 Tax=Pseudomonas sp. 2848 TaxID=2183926 RepID=UPI000DAC1840|nr:acetyltransferase [Pseudomonas sp. 2848]PZW86953.1 UDP-perosamine 4-acetyltransferase [Pseudomonas sp. 2848]
MSDEAARPLPLVILGAGGHAKVLVSVARALHLDIQGVCDPQLHRSGQSQWRGLPVLGDDVALSLIAPASILLVNGIGQTVGGVARRKLYEQFSGQGYRFATLVHPSAWVDPDVVLGEGVQVMAGAIVQADSHIGCNTIINTRAAIDHDCSVGQHAHIAPGATLCGGVTVADRCFVGSGATIIQGIEIGEDAVVGAGAVVVRHLPANQRVLGSKGRIANVPDSHQEGSE